MQVDFYHLAATPLDRVLPRIAERILADGARLLIVADDEAVLAKLDRQLWDYAPASFLPHGRDGGADDTAQPVLLSQNMVAANGARNVALADGVWRDAALGFDRAFYLFDESRIDEARGHWRALVGKDDVTRKFWKQDEAGNGAKVLSRTPPAFAGGVGVSSSSFLGNEVGNQKLARKYALAPPPTPPGNREGSPLAAALPST